VWEIATELYLRQEDVASKIQARWYAENIHGLKSLEAIDARAAQYKEIEMLGESSLKSRDGIKEPLLGANRKGEHPNALAEAVKAKRGSERKGADAPKPSVRAQLKEGKKRLAKQCASAPQKAKATKPHEMSF
jgi:hypothetical protein